MTMEEYIEDLRREHSIGRLLVDFIYPGAYEWLDDRNLIAKPQSEHWEAVYGEASRYYQLYITKYGRKLVDIGGETLYPSDIERRSMKRQKAVTYLTMKMLVYEFIASGKAYYLLKELNNEG